MTNDGLLPWSKAFAHVCETALWPVLLCNRRYHVLSSERPRASPRRSVGFCALHCSLRYRIKRAFFSTGFFRSKNTHKPRGKRHRFSHAGNETTINVSAVACRWGVGTVDCWRFHWKRRRRRRKQWSFISESGRSFIVIVAISRSRRMRNKRV